MVVGPSEIECNKPWKASFEICGGHHVVCGDPVSTLSKVQFLWHKTLWFGSNPEAANNAGFPTQRIVLISFLLCGALAGLTGFLFLARFGNITVVAGIGFELKSVAAVVVGGVNIFGGSGSIFGATLGAVLIDLLENSLIRGLQISEFWRDALLGLLILASVATDSIFMKRIRLYWAKRHAASTNSNN